MMKKILTVLLALGCLPTFASSVDQNNSFPTPCRVKCDNHSLYSKYVNSAPIKDTTYYNGKIILAVAKSPSTLKPGKYYLSLYNQGEYDHLFNYYETDTLCGVFGSVVTDSGDFVEFLMPDTARVQTTSGGTVLPIKDYSLDYKFNPKSIIYSSKPETSSVETLKDDTEKLIQGLREKFYCL